MSFRKSGQIFYAENYGFNFAKSPQAIVFEDFVRIYFSTCMTDQNKYICDIFYVDYDKHFKNILGISKSPVIDRGGLGCFDEHGIFPFSPFLDENKLYAYISGISRRVSVSVETGIGISVSDNNGENFKRLGKGPILSSTLKEPFLIMDGFVKKYAGLYHMWYIFGTDWNVFSEGQDAERVYKIGHAISTNGIDWEKEGNCIINEKQDMESQALPTVCLFNNIYYMFFCYRKSYDFRNNIENSYRIGCATSKDLKKWDRHDELSGLGLSKKGWDSEMLCYPNAFLIDDKMYMLYNGNKFGKYGFGLAEWEV